MLIPGIIGCPTTAPADQRGPGQSVPLVIAGENFDGPRAESGDPG